MVYFKYAISRGKVMTTDREIIWLYCPRKVKTEDGSCSTHLVSSCSSLHYLKATFGVHFHPHHSRNIIYLLLPDLKKNGWQKLAVNFMNVRARPVTAGGRGSSKRPC